MAAVPAHLRLVRPGYLHFTDLPGFLGGALVVAFPSTGEGFGLPVLEAMACGAPVLTTHRTSLPEVGGDAVAYTEPDAAEHPQAALRGAAGRPGAPGGAGRGGPRPGAGVHLGRLGRGAHGLLPACGSAAGTSNLAAHASHSQPMLRPRATRGDPARRRAGHPAAPADHRARPSRCCPPPASRSWPTSSPGRPRAGVTRVVLATSYRAEMFAECFGDGSRVRPGDRLRAGGGPAGHRRRRSATPRPACAAARTTRSSC